jgi:hypothetical protein
MYTNLFNRYIVTVTGTLLVTIVKNEHLQKSACNDATPVWIKNKFQNDIIYSTVLSWANAKEPESH